MRILAPLAALSCIAANVTMRWTIRRFGGTSRKMRFDLRVFRRLTSSES